MASKSNLTFIDFITEIARSEKILSNPGFLQKAPKAKVESEQTKLAQNKAMLTAVNEKLRSLNK